MFSLRVDDEIGSPTTGHTSNTRRRYSLWNLRGVDADVTNSVALRIFFLFRRASGVDRDRDCARWALPSSLGTGAFQRHSIFGQRADDGDVGGTGLCLNGGALERRYSGHVGLFRLIRNPAAIRCRANLKRSPYKT